LGYEADGHVRFSSVSSYSGCRLKKVSVILALFLMMKTTIVFFMNSRFGSRQKLIRKIPSQGLNYRFRRFDCPPRIFFEDSSPG